MKILASARAHPFIRFIKVLSRADAAFYILPLLMLNLIAGTIADSSIGLYQANHYFFASPVGYALVGALALCLTLKFLSDSEWSLKKSGINLAHFGALILLFGGLIAALSSHEGFMLIPEGQTSPYVYDYDQRVLYIFQDERLAAAIPSQKIAATPWPIHYELLSQCANCAIQKRAEHNQGYDPKILRGMAQFMALESKPSEKDPEQNLSGITFKISDLDDNQNGVYIAFDAMPKPIDQRKGNHDYKIMFGKEQRKLPFALHLDKFNKENYPGTETPKSYSSDVKIIEGATQWPTSIEMNKPLRYKGYTLYQSSFQATPDHVATILSVVENKGRLFPYFGAAIIGIGLLLHFFLTLRERKA